MRKKNEIRFRKAGKRKTRKKDYKFRGFTNCETFEISAVKKIIETKDSAFLKVCYGMSKKGYTYAFLVAADASGNDLVPLAPVFLFENLMDGKEPADSEIPG